MVLGIWLGSSDGLDEGATEGYELGVNEGDELGFADGKTEGATEGYKLGVALGVYEHFLLFLPLLPVAHSSYSMTSQSWSILNPAPLASHTLT